jgi:hypothetical protein
MNNLQGTAQQIELAWRSIVAHLELESSKACDRADQEDDERGEVEAP